VGILSRYFINEYFNINVFTEYLSIVSIAYYSLFATFIVFTHELFSFFNINIIPDFLINMLKGLGIILEFIFIKPFLYVYSLTSGKYSHVSHIKSSRYAKVPQVDYGSSSYYPSGTEVSRLSSEVKTS